MAKCIYCGADANSGEHWMPKTFGAFRNFEQLFDLLCVDRNNALGDELDQEVANTGTTALGGEEKEGVIRFGARINRDLSDRVLSTAHVLLLFVLVAQQERFNVGGLEGMVEQAH